MSKQKAQKDAVIKLINRIHWQYGKGHIMDINFRSKKVSVKHNVSLTEQIPFAVRDGVVTFVGQTEKAY